VHQVGCKISILYHDARSKIRQICVRCLKFIITDAHGVSGDCAASVFIGLLVIIFRDLLNYSLRSVATLMGITWGHFKMSAATLMT
jgi:hypothetical protein